MRNLVIRNARIVDGCGAPPFEADLAVQDGQVAEIGHDLGHAANTFDAEGLVLAPGIVDVHTHYDAQLTWDRACTPSPALGVTTVAIGNCGFTITPNRPAVRELTSHPAKIYGIRDRGILMPGAWADMILFDPETVGIGAAERVHDLPAGESRIIRRPCGLVGVRVNGVQVHDGKEYLDHARPPGQVLTQFAA